MTPLERGDPGWSTGAGCGCPGEIQWQVSMFDLSFKVQRSFFLWTGLRFPSVTGIELF